MDFKAGDVVYLKSGGPPMTIQAVGDFHNDFGDFKGAFCVWFSGEVVSNSTFDLKTLAIWKKPDLNIG